MGGPLVALLGALSACQGRGAVDQRNGDAGSQGAIDLAIADVGARLDLASAGDLAASPFQPHPPAGATACGEGDLTEQEVAAACELGSMFFPEKQRRCDAVTTAGAHWQAWCVAPTAARPHGTAYLFVHWRDVRATGAYECGGSSQLLGGAYYELGAAGASISTQSEPGAITTQTGAEVYVELEDAGVAAGTATFWLEPTPASGGAGCTPIAVAGARFQWGS